MRSARLPDNLESAKRERRSAIARAVHRCFAQSARIATACIGGTFMVSAAHAQVIAPAAWRLERIGTTAGEAVGPDVVSLALATNGQVYVADGRDHQIILYDTTGKRRATFGRSGSGPGEYQRLAGLAWTHDTLVAYDPGAFRLTYLSLTGGVVGTAAWPGTWFAQYLLGPGGPRAGVYAMGYTRSTITVKRGQSGVVTAALPKQVVVFLEILGSRAVRQLTAIGDSAATPRPDDCEVRAKGIIHIMSTLPGGTGPVDAFTSDGRLASTTDNRSRVVWTDAQSGARVTRTSPAYAPVPVTDAIWAREAREYLEYTKANGPLVCTTTAFQRPATLPPIRRLVADDAGNVWVEVTTSAGARLDVYNGAGTLIASMPAPPYDDTMPFVVRGEHAAFVVRDSDDVAAVEIYRILRR
ncbi:MAG: hypothetical protein ABJB74_17890 [Gemmatimonas sp.]